MSADWYVDLIEFHAAFNHHAQVTPGDVPHEVFVLRRNLIHEEMLETFDAMNEGDIPEIADGLADLIYVAIGTALAYGIDLRPIWDEVHRSNMAKFGGGKDANGKSQKPPGWTPPNIKGELIKQGWKE